MGQTITGYVTNTPIVYTDTDKRVISVLTNFYWLNPSPAYSIGVASRPFLGLRRDADSPNFYSYIISTTGTTSYNGGVGQFITLARLTAVSIPTNQLMIFF